MEGSVGLRILGKVCLEMHILFGPEVLSLGISVVETIKDMHKNTAAKQMHKLQEETSLVWVIRNASWRR